MRYIAKQVKETGKWAVFSREGSRKIGYVDTLIEVVELGMHTACIAEACNTDVRNGVDPADRFSKRRFN